MDSSQITSDQKVAAILRQQIMDGTLTAERKISEVTVSEMLQVSRTPARLALRTLEHEGLLRKRDGRGYRVLAFSDRDLGQAYEVRAALEGLAAGTLARHGLTDEQRELLQRVTQEIDELLDSTAEIATKIDGFQTRNRLFHQAIMQESGNAFIGHAFQRLANLPLVSLGTIVFNAEKAEEELQRLKFANMQHRLILDAILRRDAMRAEMLMREHANQIPIYSNLFV